MRKHYSIANLVIPLIAKFLVPDGRYGNATLFVDFLFLPVVLLVLNGWLISKTIERSLLKLSVLAVLGLLLGNVLAYAIWGMWSGMFFNPDAETVYLFRCIIIYQTAFLTIGFFLIAAVRWIWKRGTHDRTVEAK